MKYILFNHSTEKYTVSNKQPADPDNFDIIDLEAKKVIAGPTGTYDLKDNDLLDEAEAEDDSPPEHEPVSESE